MRTFRGGLLIGLLVAVAVAAVAVSYELYDTRTLKRTVRRGERRIELTPKEFALLEYLMLNRGHRVTRAMLIEHVWNLSFDTMTNVVDVYINYLRRKVDEGA